MTDEYISDMSFVVNSYSIGFGFSYQLSKRVAVKAAYFQTYYGDYDHTNADNPQIKDSFTRTNRVFGVGCQLDF
jgi:long-chain fatty acid transport protein